MSEKKIFQLLDWCLWILNPLLIVLAIFDQQIQAGLLFQWMGKFHPLALHFPIVFGILIAIYFLFFQTRRLLVTTEKLLLAINAILASVVVLFGILLSVQNGYDGKNLDFHKWAGIVVAMFSWLFIYVLHLKGGFKKILALLFVFILIGSTHKGAQLTHGVNALSFPQAESSLAENEIVNEETATVYTVAVKPILNRKCISCHGMDKSKGDLRLNTPENILKGGKNGDLLTLNSDGLFLERLHLPLDDEEHMPPEGKLQLTSDELSILRKWVKSGGSFDIKLKELAPNDSLFLLVNNYRTAASQKAALNFDLPDLDEFNSNYCTVNYLFNGSDEVEVNFFQGSKYEQQNLRKLGKIKDQVVSLNMQGMPLSNEDLNVIIQFKNLRKVNLNNTGLELALIEDMKSLSKLKALSICGIEFSEAELDKFLDQATFSSLHVWTQNTDEEHLSKLIEKYADIKIVVGDNLKDEIMKISNPTIVQDSSIFSNHINVKIKHLLKGVLIRYTTDGSEPDSLSSTEYTKPIRLSKNAVVKTKAFKSGWLSSNLVKRIFYKSAIQPDTIYLLNKPHERYKNEGAKTLINFDLGRNNTLNGEWLAYKDSDMEFIVGFKQQQALESVHFNALVHLDAHIFPINSIDVLGSNDNQQFLNIAKISFPKANENDPLGANTYSCNFPESTSFKYYKFIVRNQKKIPDWHPAKGQTAWIFVDELFLN